MTVVIDVGCAQAGSFSSIDLLIHEFEPDRVYGFDPNWQVRQVAQPVTVPVVVSAAAAWTYDGEIMYASPGTGGTVMDGTGRPVPCVDLARFLRRNADERTILKIDAEGAEYPLLEHLIETGTDSLLELAWVEWHPAWDTTGGRRAHIEQNISCELVEWRW